MSDILIRLAQTIENRKNGGDEKSYVSELIKSGSEKCAEKFGEEAVEAIIAAAKRDKKNLTEEAADVLFHMLVMLSSCDVDFKSVLKELERREGKSGLIEKSERKNNSYLIVIYKANVYMISHLLIFLIYYRKPIISNFIACFHFMIWKWW